MRDDTVKDAGSGHIDDSEPVTAEPSDEEVTSVRRSTRAVKPGDMFTYDHLRPPSFQP